MKKSGFLLVCLLLLGFYSLFAQDIQVRGTVTASVDGSPVPGAYVIVKGLQTGTATDADGKYSLTVGSNATLVFSSIGMKSKEVTVGGSLIIDVVLDPDIIGMDEVIVVGYTTVRKEANTGAVNVVKSDKLRDVPEVSFDKMISGKMPGIMITSASGQPGAASQIRVRGISSLTSGNEPLIVVDGTPVMQGDQSVFTNTSNALSSINPNDVESITLLKDASAASIYGSRGANGVLIITTKSGKLGKPRIGFRASYGVSKLANDNNYGVMNSKQLYTFMRDAVTNIGKDPDNPASGLGRYYVPNSLITGKTYDWMDIVTRPGKQQEYELTASGGNEKSSHYISAGYTGDEGVFYGINYQKYQLRANLDQKINDWISTGVRINGAYTRSDDVPMQDMYTANPIFAGQIIPPWTPLYDAQGEYNLNIPVTFNTNPRANAAYDDQWEKQNRLMGTLFLEIKPFKGFIFKTNNSYELTDGEGRSYSSAKADYLGNTMLYTSNTKFTQLTTSNTLSYNTHFNNKHSLNFLIGQEAQRNDFNLYSLVSPNVDPDIPFPNTATSGDDDGDYNESTRTILSFFGIADYQFANKYFLKLHLRTDGSSRFGKDTKWGTFYSVGASWVITNEDFMHSFSMIDLLKLRVSYGVNGNDAIPVYAQWGVYGSREFNGVSGLAPDQLSNPDLAWELNKTYNLGLDFGFLRRITGSVEYYQRKTTHMLLANPLSRTTGFSQIQENVGEVINKGFEALVNLNLLNGDIRWDAGANIAYNKSKILSLSTGQNQIINGNLIHKVGQSMYMFYLFDYAGVNPVNGEALWYDENGKITNDYKSARLILAGSPEPKFTGGINSSLAWKGISVDVTFEFRTGNKILIDENHYLNSDGYLWGANQAITGLDYWKKPGDITRNPKPLADNTTFSNGFGSTRWMQNGDFMRIKNLTLSYVLPAHLGNRMGIEQIRIYTSAINLYTFHKVDFWDPERGVSGAGYGIYPQTKKIMFGIELSL
jgi:TonB-dependent starch-binding outer membrane protein SusC